MTLARAGRYLYEYGQAKAQGLDVSRYNKFFDPGKATQRIDFAIQKVTEGTAYTDLLIEEIWQGVRQVPVRGAYHYGRNGMSWKAQADHFLNTAAKYDYHFHAYDLEGVNNVYGDTFFADVRRTMDYWKAQTAKPVVLYTNGSTYKLFAAAIKRLYPDAQAWLDDMEFWYAWPSLTAPAPILPAGRDTWTFWQYRWDGPPDDWGNGIPCDVNWYNGTVDELHAWAEVTPPPTEEPMAYRYEMVSTNNMTFRAAPDVTSGSIPPYKVTAGVKMYGNETAPGQGIYAQPGDNWLHVLQIGSTPVDGWVAEIHKGEKLCTLTDTQPPAPQDKHTVEVLVDGTRQFYIEL